MLSGKKSNKQKTPLSAGKEGALWQCPIQARIKALIPGTESHSSSSTPLAPSTDKSYTVLPVKRENVYNIQI